MTPEQAGDLVVAIKIIAGCVVYLTVLYKLRGR